MPDQIGNIAVPVVAASGTFPLQIDFGCVLTIAPQVVTHTFGAGNAKREQRYYLGTGARQWQIERDLDDAERISLTDFWEGRQGAYQPFTFDAPNEDGSVEVVTVQFADEPLSIDYQPGEMAHVSVRLIEVNTGDGGADHPIAATVDRFPSAPLAAALTAQAVTMIPLVHIKVRKPGYPDNIYVSDRRCTVGGQIFQARLLRWSEITQTAVGLPNLSGESDNVEFVFGNADRVMRMLADDVQLEQAEVSFSIFNVDTSILCNFWKGTVMPGGWKSDAGPEFTLQCSDRLNSPFVVLPPRIIDRKCDALYNDALGECPFALEGALDLAHYPGADASFCDHGYDTANGCLAHGMKKHYRGIIAIPQAVRIKDNSTGFFGIGRSSITSVSLVADSVYGYPLPIVVTDVDFPLKAKIIAGRDEGDFYEALGIACEGPIVFSGGLQTLDGQPQHGYPGPLGLRLVPGNDPAGATDFLSLDQSGDQTDGDFRKVFSGSSTYLDNFSAGVAFAAIRRTDQKGLQLTTLDQHDLELLIGQGWQGWRWSAPGARAAGSMTNPVWFAVNAYLLALRLWRADAATQEQYFDVQAAIDAAAVCDTVVPRIVESDEGDETQFKFIGVLQDQRPARDWLNDILANCLGYYSFANGKLRVGIRDNASAVSAYTAGNMLFKSLELSPVAPQFTRLTASFADREHDWVANTATFQDDDYAQEIGGGASAVHRSASINLAGTADISPAQRIVNIRGREEIGGVNEAERKVARTAAWKTTLLGLDTDPGTVVSITDPEMPGGAGKLRVERVTLHGDWSMSIQARTVTDSMYDLVTAPKPADVRPGPIPPEVFPLPLQSALFPYQESAAVGDALFDPAEKTFTLAQEYQVLADDSVNANLVATFKFPPNALIADMPAPVVRSIVNAAAGGALDGDENYWVAVCAAGSADGQFSQPSNILEFHIPAGTNTNLLTLSSITWPSVTPDISGYSVFVGQGSDRVMCFQFFAAGFPATITIPGPLLKKTYNLPNPNNLKVRIKATEVLHGGVEGFPVDQIIGNRDFIANQAVDVAGIDAWTGRKLIHAGRRDGVTPLSAYSVTAFNASNGQFTVDRDLVDVMEGDVLLLAIAGVDNSGDPKTIADPGLVNAANYDIETGISTPHSGLASGQDDGAAVLVLLGKSAGLSAKIVETDPAGYRLASDLPVDATSLWIVVKTGWLYAADSKTISAADVTTSFELRLPTANFLRTTMLVGLFIVDTQGNESLEAESPLRMIYVFGEGPEVIVVTEDMTLGQFHQQVNIDTTNGPVTVTLPPSARMLGRRMLFKKISDDANAATIAAQTVDGEQQTIDSGTSRVLLSKDDALEIAGNRG